MAPRSRVVLLAVLSLVSVALSGPARAQPPATAAVAAPTTPPVAARPTTTAPPSTPPVGTEEYWYGWQTLGLDAAATVVAFGAVVSGSVPALAATGGAVLLGGPLVHLGNGRPLAALGSLGLRVGLPTLGGAMGLGSSSGNGFGGGGAMILGALVGLGGAIAIDASVLARGTRPLGQDDDRYDPDVPPIISLAPAYDARTRTASLGLGGTF